MMRREASIKNCYGEPGSVPDCADCGIRSYCRDFREFEDALFRNRSRIAGIPENLPDTGSGVDAEPPKELAVVRFFLELETVEFLILRNKLRRPDLKVKELAGECGISRRKIYDFYKKITRCYPALKPVLYRRKVKKDEY